jgi:hypothetical protein
MATRWGRFTRGWLAALFSTLVAAGSHTLAGGSGPSGIALALALAFAGITCIALTGKRLSLPRLAAAVALSQFAFHAAFSTIGSPIAGMAGGAHDHGAIAASTAAAASSMTHVDAWMWLGHAAAAVLTIFALRHGEGAFWRLRGIALLAVRTVLATFSSPRVAPRSIPRPSIVGRFFVPRTTSFIRTSLGLRGPPVYSVA